VIVKILFGLGTDSIRWIPIDDQQKIVVSELRKQIQSDLDLGNKPFMVIGTTGTVGTGAVDPLSEISEVCKEFGLWFHVDGAYGGFAAALPELSREFEPMKDADSVAVDPHKWLYAPLEAGCALVRDPKHMTDTFSYRPPYYSFDRELINYVDYGIQNSREFKALKVWLALKQAGKQGYIKMIRDDIMLARYFFDLAKNFPGLEVFTCKLSITTFRYLPSNLKTIKQEEKVADYLNLLNQTILKKVELSGEAFISNAVINDIFVLRICIVNFRTSSKDMEALAEIIVRLGKVADQEIRPQTIQ